MSRAPRLRPGSARPSRGATAADRGPDRPGASSRHDATVDRRRSPERRRRRPRRARRRVRHAVFVYDEDHLRARCREAVAGFGAGVAYATKAFLCKAMAALALEEGMALDVSTGGELAVALAGGATGERLVCHGNNKSSEELGGRTRRRRRPHRRRLVRRDRPACAALDRAGRDGAPGGRRTRLLLRVTPGVEAHTHEYVMTGQEDTKFGFSLASGAAAEAVERAPERCRASSSSACTPTSAARSSSSTRSPRSSPRSPRSWSRTASRSAASAAASASPTSRARWRPRSPSGRGRCTRRLRRPVCPPTVRLTAEPGRAIVADRRP